MTKILVDMENKTIGLLLEIKGFKKDTEKYIPLDTSETYKNIRFAQVEPNKWLVEVFADEHERNKKELKEKVNIQLEQTKKTIQEKQGTSKIVKLPDEIKKTKYTDLFADGHLAKVLVLDRDKFTFISGYCCFQTDVELKKNDIVDLFAGDLRKMADTWDYLGSRKLGQTEGLVSFTGMEPVFKHLRTCTASSTRRLIVKLSQYTLDPVYEKIRIIIKRKRLRSGLLLKSYSSISNDELIEQMKKTRRAQIEQMRDV